MEFSARGGVTSLRERVPSREIIKNVADMGMGSWISSLLEETLQNAEFADDDFMGKRGDIVSVSELIQVMVYYATVMGYSPTWEASPSSTLDDFERRPGVFQTMARKIENWSTQSGTKKIAAVKKVIRKRVSDKATRMHAKPNPLGVFVGDADDMANIYKETDYKRIVCNLHRLGKHRQDNPRFYIHMVYRYYMNEFHRQLADENKVLRFPSIQKIMDIKQPLDCSLSIPPEFRTFLKNARGNAIAAVPLPVPSKTNDDEVVYGYDFESALPWVPVMRARIFELFVKLGARDSPNLFLEMYPKYLVKGVEGCEKGNKAVVDGLARSIEMENLVKTLHGFRVVSQERGDFLDKVLSVDSRITGIYQRYNNHPFVSEGEQLRERLGFLLQDSVRGVFRFIADEMPSFCNDIYTSLSISFKTHEVFIEYCTTKTFMNFKRKGEEDWRDFVIDIPKICCILHAWSRKSEANQFVQTYGSVDGYMKSILEKVG